MYGYFFFIIQASFLIPLFKLSPLSWLGPSATSIYTTFLIVFSLSEGIPKLMPVHIIPFTVEQAKGSPEVQERLILGAREGHKLNFNLPDIKLQTSPSIHSLYSKYLSLPTVHSSGKFGISLYLYIVRKFQAL